MIVIGCIAGLVAAAIVVGWQTTLENRTEDRMDEGLHVAPVFRQPGPGDGLSVRLNSGRIVRGQINDLQGDTVLIATEGGELTLNRNEISPESRTLLFKDDFDASRGTNRPSVISNAELLRRLASGNESPADLGLGPNVQYVIMGDRSIFIYYNVGE